MNPEEIKTIFAINKDFFKEEGLGSRVHNEFNIYRRKVSTQDRDTFKGSLNVFYLACMNCIKDEKLKLTAKLRMFEILNLYAREYRSSETLTNIIKEIESPEIKGRMFNHHSFLAKYIYADTLFTLYNIENENVDGKFSQENIERLLKAKCYLLKIYSQHVDKKNILKENQIEDTTVMLASCLAQLSRWFEPLYYLNQLKKSGNDNPNIDYLNALNLEAIKDKTCLDYNGLLLLEIIESCSRVRKNPNHHPVQLDQTSKIEKQCRNYLKTNKTSIPPLRKHKMQYDKGVQELGHYKMFCIEHQLFLNEHSFFCSCNSSTRDDLSPVTKHSHTQIEWVDQFHLIIDSIVFDFVSARHSYYRANKDTPLEGHFSSYIKRPNAKSGIRASLLKSSFRQCYSILDQIGTSIFQVLNIPHEKILKEKFKDGHQQPPKMYFLNMWDYGLFDDEMFNKNIYLISLYSLAKDLDKTSFSALKEFKKIRNLLEHQHLLVSDDLETHLGNNRINYEDLLQKTNLLLMITKSAIYSLNNLIRRQSKLIEHNDDKKKFTPDIV